MKEMVHYPVASGKYELNPWYSVLSARFLAIKDYLKDEFFKRRIPWSEFLEELFDRGAILRGLLRNEQIDLLVRRRVGYIQENLNRVIELNPRRAIKRVNITCPIRLVVYFVDGGEIEVDSNFSFKYKRVKIKRVTQEDKDKTLEIYK